MLFKFNKKGQVEFIVILGFLAIAVVGIYYVFQSGVIQDVTMPQSIKEEQKLVKNFVENVIRDGSINTIRTLETHGGYLTPEQMPGYAFFARQEVPYWQQCQNDISPQRDIVAERFEEGIKNHIISSLQGIEEVYGKATDFNINSVGVEANILDSKVDITVNMPTRVQGYPIREPYTVTIPTKFGRILDFAADFAHEAATERFWETFTIDAIMFSDLPTYGHLWECGETMFVPPSRVADELEGLARYVRTNTRLWENGVRGGDNPNTYGITDIGIDRKTYPDLDIGFKLQDGFSINVFDPVIITNSENIISSSVIFVPPLCMSTYEQTYSISYPIIIRVRDSLLDKNFYFATSVYVDRLDYGFCDQDVDLASSCEDLQYDARIKVVDGSESMLIGAKASFGGCFINESDQDGFIEGKIPYGQNRLTVFHTPEYSVYSEDVSSSSIAPNNDAKITLHRKGNLTFHFVYSGSTCINRYNAEEMIIINMTAVDGSGSFFITNNNLEFNIDECLGDDIQYCEQCEQSMGSPNPDPQSCRICTQARAACLRNGLLNEVNVNYIPGGDYYINLMIMNPRKIETESTSKPYVTMPIRTNTIEYSIPEDDKDINIIIISNPAFRTSDDIYREAGERGEDEYDDCCGFLDLRCILGDFAGIVWDDMGQYDDSCEARGLMEAINYINDNRWNFGWEVC